MNSYKEISPDDMIMVRRDDWDRLKNQGNDIYSERVTPEYQAQKLYGKPYRIGYNFHSKHFSMSLPNIWWVRWFIIPILKRIARICNATDWDKNTRHEKRIV